MLRDGVHELYIKQFHDMINRGVVSKISQEEMDSYSGPVNYIVHHEVYKDSNSTPVCLVSDSSFRNGQTSLNDCLVKGPNMLADIFDHLIKFRSYEMALVYDVTKAYNSMKTRQVERHVWRLWMRLSSEEDWQVYGFNTVQFGDRPAAALLTVAVEKAVENYEEVASKLGLPTDIFKEDARKLLLDTYVNNGTT